MREAHKQSQFGGAGQGKRIIYVLRNQAEGIEANVSLGSHGQGKRILQECWWCEAEGNEPNKFLRNQAE